MIAILKIVRKRLYIAFGLLNLLLCVGVLGYKYISDYSWLDAIYMTVITVTTVGFGEVNPLSNSSKIFTILLIMTSVLIVGYAITIITEFLLSTNNIKELKLRRMIKTINSISNHIIVCGYGKNGKQVIKKLQVYKKSFVVIEKDKELVNENLSEDIPFVCGNAIDDLVLRKAGLERAETLICALPDDADNLFIVLSARQINPNLRIISRASLESSYKKLKIAGADNVILPDKIGGDHMASLVVVPDLVEFIDNLSVVGKDSLNIEEIPSDYFIKEKDAKIIDNLSIMKDTGCNIIGFKSAEGEYMINPERDTILVKNSKIIVLGRPDQIKKLNSLYNF